MCSGFLKVLLVTNRCLCSASCLVARKPSASRQEYVSNILMSNLFIFTEKEVLDDKEVVWLEAKLEGDGSQKRQIQLREKMKEPAPKVLPLSPQSQLLKATVCAEANTQAILEMQDTQHLSKQTRTPQGKRY